ncbi:MAG TPA: hypothetical protein VH476_07195 [Solirubrobacterales bacterium]|jgi:hypothetical protein
MADTTESIPEAGPPSRDQAAAWVGWKLDEVGGAPVGRVHSVYVDSESGAPAWVIAALEGGGVLGRRRPILVAVPLRDCAGAAGRVWSAYPRDPLRGAPIVDPRRPLLREHELTICGHYGIGEGLGRAAEVAGRAEGSVTSQPFAM